MSFRAIQDYLKLIDENSDEGKYILSWDVNEEIRPAQTKCVGETCPNFKLQKDLIN